jgi:hypothetical protein
MTHHRLHLVWYYFAALLGLTLLACIAQEITR